MSRRTLLSHEQRDRLFAVPTAPAEMAGDNYPAACSAAASAVRRR